MKQTVDVLVDMHILSGFDARASGSGLSHILREASALFARSTEMGNTRASDSGTGNKYGSHAFLFPSSEVGLAQLLRMKTIILVQEVAERNAFKKQALSALCRSLYCADDYRLENEYRFLLPNKRKLCIGASDSSGRCDLNKLRYLLSEHDLVIVPAINGKNESEVMNSDEFKGYLKMIVPLSRKSDSIDEDFSDFVKQIHSIILK